MQISDITPVILTYNEEPNIARVLAQLSWARDVVVVDSHSTDRTRQIVGSFPNTRFFEHAFETHAAQWTYAITQTGIASEWILALDSDYVLSEEFVRELARLAPDGDVAGYSAGFRYRVRGYALRRSIYPPRIVLCRREQAKFRQDGHTQRLEVAGGVGHLENRVDHDDRKSLAHWVVAQDRYAQLERAKLLAIPCSELAGADRLRARGPLAPIAVFLHCLFVKGLILHGLPGWYYAYQRAMAELLLALYVIEDRLVKRGAPR